MSKELSSLGLSLMLSNGESESLKQIIIKRFFKLSCSMRAVKNKGAVLILILSYLVTNVYSYILYAASKQISTRAILGITGLTLPLAGWLADVRYGRYNVLSFCLWMMWISSLLLTLTLVVADFTNFKHVNILVVTILIPLGIGWG